MSTYYRNYTIPKHFSKFSKLLTLHLRSWATNYKGQKQISCF